jgi:hypothetical protein
LNAPGLKFFYLIRRRKIRHWLFVDLCRS